MNREAGRKGVSPLIAAVLLIAFTMAVAAILTAWVTTFTQEQTQQLGNESSEQIDCTFGQLEVFDENYDDTNNEVVVTLTNTGTVDFDNNVSVSVFDSNGELLNVSSGTYTINSSSTESIPVTITSDPESFRAAADKCPKVSVEGSFQ